LDSTKDHYAFVAILYSLFYFWWIIVSQGVGSARLAEVVCPFGGKRLTNRLIQRSLWRGVEGRDQRRKNPTRLKLFTLVLRHQRG